jgi:hypothetical protein
MGATDCKAHFTTADPSVNKILNFVNCDPVPFEMKNFRHDFTINRTGHERHSNEHSTE